VDPVSEATRGWITEQASLYRQHGTADFTISNDAESWLTRVVHRGFEEAVREVVPPDRQEVVLDVVRREAPGQSEVQVAQGADLPRVVIDHLAPQFNVLTDLGLNVNTWRLSKAFEERVAAAIKGEAHAVLPLPMAMFAGLPGYPFTQIPDDDDEAHKDDDEAHKDDSEADDDGTGR